MKDWNILVVGDEKTPKDWEFPNVEFLSLEKQLTLGYSITKLVPTNSYARKNIGYLYAISKGRNLILNDSF
jgi:hypothetical protein